MVTQNKKQENVSEILSIHVRAIEIRIIRVLISIGYLFAFITDAFSAVTHT